MRYERYRDDDKEMTNTNTHQRGVTLHAILKYILNMI